jgi:hypothetical protein
VPLRQNEDEMWWPMNDTDLGDKAGGQYKDFATYGVIASEHVFKPCHSTCKLALQDSSFLAIGVLPPTTCLSLLT